MAVPKIQELEESDEKCGFDPFTQCDKRRLFTVQSERQQGLMNRQCSAWSYKFCIVKCIVIIYVVKVFRFLQVISKILQREIERGNQRTDQDDFIISGKIVFDDNNPKLKSWVGFRQTSSSFLFVFLSNFFVLLLEKIGCFWRSPLSNVFDESTVCLGVLCIAAG